MGTLHRSPGGNRVTLLHGLSIGGTFAGLIGSIMQAVSELAARARITHDHTDTASCDDRRFVRFGHGHQGNVVTLSRRCNANRFDRARISANTSALCAACAWVLNIMGALYAVLVTIPSS